MPTVEALEKEVKGLQADFEKFVGTELKEHVQAQDQEIKAIGKTTEETGAKLAKSNERWERSADEIKSALEELQAKVGRLDMTGGLDNAAPDMSLGSCLVESDAYKSMLETKTTDRGMQSPAVLENWGLRDVLRGASRKAAMANMLKKFSTKDSALTSTELGALVDRFRWDQVVQDPLRPRRIMDLMTMVPVMSNAVEYPRENQTIALYTELSAQLTAGNNVATVDNAVGFRAGQVVTLDVGGGDEENLTIDTGGVDLDASTLTFTTNAVNTHAVDTSVTADDFDFTPEAMYKPIGRIEYTLETETIKTIAELMPLSVQMAEDSNMVQTLLENRMREFLELSIERNILYGDDSNTQLAGIVNDPDIQTYLQSSGQPGDTELDAIRRSFTNVFLSFFPVDAVVLHPNNWEAIETLKGDDGHYIFSQIQTAPNVTQIWRANVVETPVMTENTWLAGSFRMGAVLWDRQDARLAIANQNRDDFERNLLTMRMESRLAQSVLRPTAFVSGTFDGSSA